MKSNNLTGLIIWWLCEDDYRRVPEYMQGESSYRTGKKHINEELESRYGRLGHGRLWVNKYITKKYGGKLSCASK